MAIQLKLNFKSKLNLFTIHSCRSKTQYARYYLIFYSFSEQFDKQYKMNPKLYKLSFFMQIQNLNYPLAQDSLYCAPPPGDIVGHHKYFPARNGVLSAGGTVASAQIHVSHNPIRHTH